MQDRVATLIGISAADRDRRLRELLQQRPGDAAGYWLQLSISVVIATLGLVQGSTAVVIGAMLIAPLMQPIVELGIGLALGSPLLTFRAAARFAGSLVLALVASAAMTRALPFHELTPELIARTSPTMLDLFIAAACALAAVYTTVHSSGETASAAAGTAIGISLVPPLCTAGWGLGTGDDDVARGAALLFTANFTAIVVLTAISILALGFGRHDVTSLEARELATGDSDGTARGVARASGRLLGRRIGVVLRILLPIMLLGAIYVPLRAALTEVAWQTSARADVRDALEPFSDRLVRQAIEIRRGRIRLGLIAIGDRQANEEALAALRAEIERRTGTTPRLDVVHVPDAEALAALAATLPETVELPAPPAAPRPPGPDFMSVLSRELEARWPTAGGELLAVRLQPGTPVRVELVHLGAALGPAALELLAPGLAERLGLEVVVVERALPTDAIIAAAGNDAALAIWLPSALESLALGREPGVTACVDVPAAPVRPGPRQPPARAVDALTQAALARAAEGGRHEISTTDRWALRFTRGTCAPPGAPPPAAGPE